MEAEQQRPVTRRGGRPTRADAAALGGRIVAVATELFLADGFGATSVERVAARAGVAKRTFYHRYRDKADLFRAVLRRLVAGWMRPLEANFAAQDPLDETLYRAAHEILTAALSEDAVRLYRVLVAEAPRFPELAAVVAAESQRGGGWLAALIAREAERGGLAGVDCRFAAEQFVAMVLAAPRRAAVGIGPRMNAAATERWARQAVALFLDGCRARPKPAVQPERALT